MSSTQRSRSPAAWLLPALAFAVAFLLAPVAWLTIFLALRDGEWRWCAWVALLVAIDFALMLRLAAAPPGKLRAALAMSGTAAAIAASLWLLTASEVGRVMGFNPLESALRMGPVLAGELLRHGLTAWDIACLVLALPLAWRLGR